MKTSPQPLKRKSILSFPITLSLLFGFMMSVSLVSAANDSEVLYHKVNKGQLHKGGSLEIQITSQTEEEIIVDIKYSLKKKSFYPIPSNVLNGSKDIALPKLFASEQAYIDLKRKGAMEIHKAQVKYVKRSNFKQYYDSYEIQVIPHSRKWVGTFLYHPDAPSVGWIKADITIKEIPVIGTYRMTSQIAK